MLARLYFFATINGDHKMSLKKSLGLFLVLALLQLVLSQWLNIDGKWLLMQEAAASESDLGFTEDTVSPLADPDSGNLEPAEPPAFPGATKLAWQKNSPGKSSITIHYPAFGNKVIDSRLAQWVTDYGQKFAASADRDPDCVNGLPEWKCIGTYAIAKASPEIISVFFRIYNYTGGAHGNYEYGCLAFELKSGKQLDRSELFADRKNAMSVIDNYCRKELAKDALLEDAVIDSSLTDGVLDRATVIPGHNGLILAFVPGEIGSFAAGPKILTVPYSLLREWLAPKFHALIHDSLKGKP